MEDFGYVNAAWLRRFLTLPNGKSSHDTLSDVIDRIDPGAFAQALSELGRAVGLPDLAGHQIAIDGKGHLTSRHDGPAVKTCQRSFAPIVELLGGLRLLRLVLLCQCDRFEIIRRIKFRPVTSPGCVFECEVYFGQTRGRQT